LGDDLPKRLSRFCGCHVAQTPQHALRSVVILHAAMSEKLAVVRRWVELYNERSDVTEFLSLLDPEVELQTPGGPRLRGHDQARDWFEKEFENVQSRIIPDRFVEEGDVVAGLGRTEVRWIESGEIAHESAALPVRIDETLKMDELQARRSDTADAHTHFRSRRHRTCGSRSSASSTAGADGYPEHVHVPPSGPSRSLAARCRRLSGVAGR
jgi:SnoaL-like domain